MTTQDSGRRQKAAAVKPMVTQFGVAPCSDRISAYSAGLLMSHGRQHLLDALASAERPGIIGKEWAGFRRQRSWLIEKRAVGVEPPEEGPQG